MKKLFRIMSLQALIAFMFIFADPDYTTLESVVTTDISSESIPVMYSTAINDEYEVCTVEKHEEILVSTSEEECEEDLLSEADIELIALITMAEAEGESEEGKRLVIDTILNRVASEHFPDTVQDVVYQANQFSSVWNGRLDKCYVQDDICELVREESREQTNYEVVFFTAGGYGKYGTPLFSEGNHYFCSYN